jgi:signal transduction histidine kinase
VQFTADASHELRHPLTAIRAVIGTLRQGSALEGSKPLVNEKLALIDQTCDRMGRVLEDLLLLARHDRQIDDQGDRRSFGLEELIEDLADLFSAPAQQQGVVLRTEIGARVPVHAQPERIRQLLVNLITNAIRFSPPGGTVTIGARNQGTDAMVWVDDQGPGIPLADRQRVFDRFWQADPSRSDPATLGLGLAIARAIATAHRGTLEAEEAPGGGCRMRLCLPRGH